MQLTTGQTLTALVMQCICCTSMVTISPVMSVLCRSAATVAALAPCLCCEWPVVWKQGLPASGSNTDPAHRGSLSTCCRVCQSFVYLVHLCSLSFGHVRSMTGSLAVQWRISRAQGLHQRLQMHDAPAEDKVWLWRQRHPGFGRQVLVASMVYLQALACQHEQQACMNKAMNGTLQNYTAWGVWVRRPCLCCQLAPLLAM